MGNNIVSCIGNKEGEQAPFLFISRNIHELHAHIEQDLKMQMKEHGVDIQSLFHLEDSGESIKIAEIKSFFTPIQVKARFAFQVFWIEDIGRMTPQAQNACLKIFEEPGEGNIIILTAQSESGILETILSRVQVVRTQSENIPQENSFYLSMIQSHTSGESDELVRYFFSGKFEKEEYISFLQTLLIHSMKQGLYTDKLSELEEDIGGILNNNLQGRYVVDKWIMRLGR